MPGSGWISDSVTADNTPSNNSPVTFTLTSSGWFSITDAFIPGDIFTVTDTTTSTVLDTTVFALLPTHWTPAGGIADSAWADSAYSHGQLALAAGSYSFDLEDIHDAGLPAGFYFRVDTGSTPVPEPASLALVGAGVLGLGFIRRRKA